VEVLCPLLASSVVGVAAKLTTLVIECYNVTVVLAVTCFLLWLSHLLLDYTD
jgi:hypothetical protein